MLSNNMSHKVKDCWNNYAKDTAKDNSLWMLVDCEIEYGKQRGGIPIQQCVRAIWRLSKKLKIHLYYSIGGGLADGKPHGHLFIYAKRDEIQKLPFINDSGNAKWFFSTLLRDCLNKFGMSLPRINREFSDFEKEISEYKQHYLAGHESLTMFRVACPMINGSCRRAIKRDGECVRRVR